MNSTWDVVQVGCHVGSSHADYIFKIINQDSRAIFIEPVDFLFNKLKENYNTKFPNNNFIFLNCAISNKEGSLKLYVPDIEIFSEISEKNYIEKKLPRWADQLASVHKTHVKDHYLNLDVKEIEVPCRTLMSIINEYNIDDLQILSIDTEGHDFEVLETLDLNVLKPKKIIFEHKHMEGTNKPPAERYNKLMSLLLEHNYKVTNKDTEDTVVEL
ncbi:MAG: FkbM family methyltransferase [Proteobacteria bacterium]|nr:FkbM family methyltransferase [Pseudomonadota bacterium]NBP14781.1 FkbM family methyltransferase [bacterium]